MAVFCHIVNDLFYLNTGGLSKKPGQVCDSRVNRTIHHLTTKAWQTHIQTQTARERLNRNQEKTMSHFCVSCHGFFKMQSFSQQSCISLLHIICISLSIFSETLIIIVTSLLEKLSLVRGGRVWAGAGVSSSLFLDLWTCSNWPIHAENMWASPSCLFALIGLSGSWCWSCWLTEVRF